MVALTQREKVGVTCMVVLKNQFPLSQFLANVLGLGTHFCLCVMRSPGTPFRSYSIKGQEGTLHPHIFGIKIEMLSSL